MADYGTDVSTYVKNDEGVSDLDPFFTEISGARVVAEQVLRRWETPRNGLFYDRTVGAGIYQLLAKRTSIPALLEKKSLLQSQAERDERVWSADVNIEPTDDTSLAVDGDITLEDGTFSLVASISNVTIDLLSPE